MRRVDLRSFPGFAPVSWLVLAILYLPLVVVVVYSFNSNRIATQWDGFSLSWYRQVFTDDDIRRVTVNSLRVAVVATAVSVVMAVGAAVALQRLRPWLRTYAGFVVGAPLVIPEIVLAVATLALFVALDVDLGLATVTLAHIAFCIPFAFLPIRARLQDMDPAVFEAAADLGGNEWRILRRVTIPLLGPGIVSGALLAFIISLDDFLISYFVAGPGSTTLPVYLYGQIRNAVTPAVNAVSTLLLLVTVVVLTASYLLGRTRRARPSAKGTS